MMTLWKDLSTTFSSSVHPKKTLVLILFFVGVYSLHAYADDAKDLLEAAASGNTTGVKLLIKKGVDVNVTNRYGATSLYIASEEGHAEVVKLLLAAKANVNKAATNSSTPLMLASQNNHTKVVELLLAAKADVNVKFEFQGEVYTALSVAKQSGHTQIVRLLEKYGAKE